jgi:hypothetical protein
MQKIVSIALAVLWSLPAVMAQNVRPANPPGAAQRLDYAYAAPKGWTSEAIPDGSRLLHSPVSNTGEKCFIGLLPVIPATGDLFSHADAAWNYTFSEFEVRPTPTFPNAPHYIRGVAAQGWEYLLIKRGIALRGSPRGPLQEQVFFGFVMVAKLGDRIGAVTGFSKDPLVSSCFGSSLENVWPRFFSTLRFTNWAPPGENGLAQKIQGVWESYGSSIGGAAATRYAFNAAGRYAETGAMQRYVGISRFVTEVWTSKTFGDGAYAVRGNEMTLTPDTGKAETAFVRLEELSQDGGKTWAEKLYILRAAPLNLNCGQFRCSNDDIEQAFERRDR